jgi:hypothetical protein
VSFSSSSRPSASGARGKAPATGSTRLPSGRERRPALAALAVILILLGAAGSALIAVSSGDRHDFVAVQGTLPPGHKLAAKDLSRGDLAGATKYLVPWANRDRLLDHYTTSWVYQGQFLTTGNVTDKPIPEGGALIGVSLESGRAPSSPIDKGDVVRIIRVPSASSEGTAVVLVNAARVTDSSGDVAPEKTGATATLNATVLVSLDKSTAVAAAAASKSLVLVKLAPGTTPDLDDNGDG